MKASSSSSSLSSTETKKPIHLVILIHGLFGSPANVATVAEELHYVHGSGGSTSATGIAGESGSDREDGEDGDEVEEERERNGGRRYRKPSASNSPSPHRLPSARAAQKRKKAQRERERGKDRKDELVVYSCNSFGFGHTWDGVDINAQRAAKEVDQEVRRLEEGEGRRVGSISFMGYSLGGLIARYLIGVLYSRSPDFFERHKPAAFVTIATPHIGTLRYGTTTNKIIHTIGRRLFSRSGRQLYCDDRDEQGRCLLEVMADPDGIFIHALQGFNKVLIVANGCHDLTVPFPTASISLSDPFQDYAAGASPLHLEVDERNIVTSYRQISYSEHEEGPGHIAHTKEDDGDITVTVATTRRSGGEDEKKQVKLPPRPALPPFLYFRWPFTYAIFFILPFLIPLWICLIIGFTTLQSYRSAKRHRLLGSKGEHQPLLASLIPATRPKSRPISRRSTPEYSSGTSTPPFELLSPSTMKIPLYLTDRQERMVRSLNGALPHMERIVAWFPSAFNAHAVVIMRDYKKFPSQEVARGVLREVAGRILDAA